MLKRKIEFDEYEIEMLGDAVEYYMWQVLYYRENECRLFDQANELNLKIDKIVKNIQNEKLGLKRLPKITHRDPGSR